jgi:hypothetical protein
MISLFKKVAQKYRVGGKTKNKGGFIRAVHKDAATLRPVPLKQNYSH